MLLSLNNVPISCCRTGDYITLHCPYIMSPVTNLEITLHFPYVMSVVFTLKITLYCPYKMSVVATLEVI